MTTNVMALDGNAAAGAIGRLFTFDVTAVIVTCGACGIERPFAELRLFGGPLAMVLRCSVCEADNIRLLETEERINLDMSGTARIEIARRHRTS